MLVRRLDLLRSMRLGLVLRMAAFALILRIVWQGQLYVAGILLGAFVTLFWIPYNTRYLELTTDRNRAKSSAALFALFATLGATLPVAAGILIQLYDFQFVLLICLLVLGVGLVLSFFLSPAGEMSIDLPGMLRRTRRLRALLLLEGIWQGVFWLGVPFSLILNKAGAEGYGAFYSLLGLLGGAAAIVAGYWSDRRGSRGPAVVASAVLGGTFSVAAAFLIADLPLWTLTIGLVYFSTYVLFPFTFTVVSERSGSCAEAMTVREFLTNIGRVFGGSAVVISIYLTGGLAPAISLGGLALIGLAISYTFIRERTTDFRWRSLIRHG
jgi:hypothetical protein